VSWSWRFSFPPATRSRRSELESHDFRGARLLDVASTNRVQDGASVSLFRPIAYAFPKSRAERGEDRTRSLLSVCEVKDPMRKQKPRAGFRPQLVPVSADSGARHPHPRCELPSRFWIKPVRSWHLAANRQGDLDFPSQPMSLVLRRQRLSHCQFRPGPFGRGGS